jgi:hypothetical protein
MPVPLRKNLVQNIRGIAKLYEAWGKPEKAEEWRKKLGPQGRPSGPSRR